MPWGQFSKNKAGLILEEWARARRNIFVLLKAFTEMLEHFFLLYIIIEKNSCYFLSLIKQINSQKFPIKQILNLAFESASSSLHCPAWCITIFFSFSSLITFSLGKTHFICFFMHYGKTLVCGVTLAINSEINSQS